MPSEGNGAHAWGSLLGVPWPLCPQPTGAQGCSSQCCRSEKNVVNPPPSSKHPAHLTSKMAGHGLANQQKLLWPHLTFRLRLQRCSAHKGAIQGRIKKPKFSSSLPKNFMNLKSIIALDSLVSLPHGTDLEISDSSCLITQRKEKGRNVGQSSASLGCWGSLW